ncbi:hypothetical protein ACQEU3_27435 [Spirillospora sp. CA-253888]
MLRTMNRVADRLVSAAVPKATAAAACTPSTFTRCSSRACGPGSNRNWRELWRIASNCQDYLSNPSYRCDCG